MSSTTFPASQVAVIGLGYVGLPIALAFARKTPVIGFDISTFRVDALLQGIDERRDVAPEEFAGCQISFTDNPELLRQATFFIIAVPTPIDKENQPDLRPLLAATTTVAGILKKGDYVIFESTVYPGCTEEDCVPVLERISGLRHQSDFKTGFSPERINPGDKEHTFTKITKVVSGCDAESLAHIAAMYEQVVEAGVHKASSIKVAEAAKIIENTQRDLNIALMNELSMIFDHMGINTHEVLEAAGTKWNFLKFFPGLVGGHCIGVDPYYLTYKARQLGHEPEVILSGRAINDGMATYVANKLVDLLRIRQVPLHEAKVLVLGITFKENVQDIRNSKVVDLVAALKNAGLTVDILDPVANKEETLEEYQLELISIPAPDYDVLVLAVPHAPFLGHDEDYFTRFSKKGIFADLKGAYRNKIKKLYYWSL